MKDNSKGSFTIKGLVFSTGNTDTIKIDELVIEGVTDLDMNEGEVDSTNKAVIQVLEQMVNLSTNVVMMATKADENKRRVNAELKQRADATKHEHEKDMLNHKAELDKQRREHEDEIEARKHSRIQMTRRNVGDLGTGQ
jgi:hypothetical protein